MVMLQTCHPHKVINYLRNPSPKFDLGYFLFSRCNISKKSFCFFIWPSHELTEPGFDLSYSAFFVKSKFGKN